jgi:hypothetical protein
VTIVVPRAIWLAFCGVKHHFPEPADGASLLIRS